MDDLKKLIRAADQLVRVIRDDEWNGSSHNITSWCQCKRCQGIMKSLKAYADLRKKTKL